jgi:hypothetical protein
MTATASKTKDIRPSVIDISTAPTARLQKADASTALLRERGLDPEHYDVDVSFTDRQVIDKESGGVVTLFSQTAKATAKRVAPEPLWPVIQPARPTVIRAIKPLTRTPKASKYKTVVGANDHQVGFRINDRGQLVPFHDDRAIDLFEQVVALVQPGRVVIPGDLLDLPTLSRWPQEAAFARTMQPSLDRTHRHLAQLRANSPRSLMTIIEGNHELRLQKYVELNAASAFGIRQANTAPDKWPVFSIQNLLRLDELGFEYLDGYPGGAVLWLNDRFRVIHGDRANSGGSTASAYINAMPHVTTWAAHVHRLELQSRTTFDGAGRIQSLSFNVGCLCRVDGAVPSVNGGTNMAGDHATIAENWAQGIGVVHYHDDGTHYAEVLQINDGQTMFHGQLLTSKKTVEVTMAA